MYTIQLLKNGQIYIEVKRITDVFGPVGKVLITTNYQTALQIQRENQ